MIACFGLSANPPHRAHLIAAQQILKKTSSREVWFIPCWQHSFGKKLALARHRWNMAKLMEQPGIKCSDIEFRRRGISYTIDTVRILKKKYPGQEFVWVIGSDIIKDQSYKKWKDWRRLSKEINFWIVQREGFEVHERLLPACFVLLPIKAPNISSTLIRERLKKGLSVKGLVIPKIEKYILVKKLY